MTDAQAIALIAALLLNSTDPRGEPTRSEREAIITARRLLTDAQAETRDGRSAALARRTVQPPMEAED